MKIAVPISYKYSYSPGPFILFLEKKVSFDFAVALYSIDAPDIPKSFAK